MRNQFIGFFVVTSAALGFAVSLAWANPGDFSCQSADGLIVQFVAPTSIRVASGDTVITNTFVNVTLSPTTNAPSEMRYSDGSFDLDFKLSGLAGQFHLVDQAIRVDEALNCDPPQPYTPPGCHTICHTNGEGHDSCHEEC